MRQRERVPRSLGDLALSPRTLHRALPTSASRMQISSSPRTGVCTQAVSTRVVLRSLPALRHTHMYPPCPTSNPYSMDAPAYTRPCWFSHLLWISALSICAASLLLCFGEAAVVSSPRLPYVHGSYSVVAEKADKSMPCAKGGVDVEVLVTFGLLFGCRACPRLFPHARAALRRPPLSPTV